VNSRSLVRSITEMNAARDLLGGNRSLKDYGRVGFGESRNRFSVGRLTRFPSYVISPNRAATLAPQATRKRAMSATVLIADDNDDNRELLQLLLANAGYDVREARDGSECLAIARLEPPDLIVMDLSMPILDGWGVFQQLEADQSIGTIPCIAVTAHAELDQNEALEMGFRAYVSKPYSGEVLLQTIATVLADCKPSLVISK
jgi:CheY-like chemotaxis protein